MLAGLLDLRDLRLADVHAAIVSSVVPTLAHEYEQMIERYFGGRGRSGPELKTGMPIRIDRPQELGADRLVNAIAAYERVGGAASPWTSALRSTTTWSRPRASTWAA